MQISPQMLLFGSSVTFVFLSYGIPQSVAINRSFGTEQNPLIWNRGRSVRNYTLRCDSSCPLTRLSLLKNHVSESESEYISGGSGIERRGKNCDADDDDENSKNSRDMYYQIMLEANPGNSLLLKDYAKFLHEVHQDIAKAEKYYGRAILASPEDAEILALYATFTWETQNDAARAHGYFDRAVKAAPDNCYILSSYAHFLWNSEEEEHPNDDHVDLQSVEEETYVNNDG